MATSGITTGLLTAGEVVKTAYELQGVFAPEDDISADRMDMGIKQLNWMLKSWQTDGCNLWRDLDVEIMFPFTASGDGQMDANYLDVFNVRYQDPAYFRPLTRVGRDAISLYPDYNYGIPSVYAPYRQRDALWMKLWPIPQVDVILRGDVARIIEDVTAPEQNIDVPQEWTECLWMNLSSRLIPSTGLRAKEPATAARIEGDGAMLYQKMLDADRPSSYDIKPWGARW